MYRIIQIQRFDIWINIEEFVFFFLSDEAAEQAVISRNLVLPDGNVLDVCLIKLILNIVKSLVHKFCRLLIIFAKVNFFGNDSCFDHHFIQILFNFRLVFLTGASGPRAPHEDLFH